MRVYSQAVTVMTVGRTQKWGGSSMSKLGKQQYVKSRSRRNNAGKQAAPAHRRSVPSSGAEKRSGTEIK